MNQSRSLEAIGCYIEESSQYSDPFNSSDRILHSCNISWIAPINPHPHCIINLSRINQELIFFNTVGFYFSSCTPSNASLIELYYRSKVGEKWNMLGEFALQRYAGWQNFNFKPIEVARMTFVYVRLVDNFDDKHIKLTQLTLTYQEHQNDKQIRQELSRLRTENERLKQRITHQENAMTQMKNIMLRLENQINSMRIETQSESSDQFAKLNHSGDTIALISKQTRQIVIDSQREEQGQKKDSFEVLH